MLVVVCGGPSDEIPSFLTARVHIGFFFSQGVR
jgi:hypothetical protein